MICSICGKDKLPHQLAYKPSTNYSVCFGGDRPPYCGGSSLLPSWVEKSEGEPAYVILNDLSTSKALV